MQQREKRGGKDQTVGYESQPPTPPTSGPVEITRLGSPRLPAELAATYADGAEVSALASTALGATALGATALAPLSINVALGATIAAPLPNVAEGSSSEPRAGASTLSVLPRVEPAGDAVRLVASPGEPRYRNVRTLGEGGMGEVALVEDLDIGRTVALKRLRGQDAQGAALVARFVDEVRTIGSLEHPNIVPIHDVGVDEHGRYFFVMKFVDGETLEAIVEKLRAGDVEARRVYTVQRRVEIFVGLLRALQYAHARGVVHRDVKPANIMVGRFGEVVLMDWGVARPIGKADADAARARVSPAEMHAAPSRASETHDGALIGTPLYMSPEQAAGDNDALDARSDLYSACVVLHELLGLRHLREAKSGSLAELLSAIASDDAPEVHLMFGAHASNPQGVPAELTHFLHKGLARDRAKRWSSADEMMLELEAILDGRCRVQCHLTFLKRSTRELGRLVDRSPRAVMLGLTFGALATFALVANALRDLIG
ncbi:MAG: serine/threonine protein kinase [Myxococcota bacterium]|nr:serine/threonine protein kinase [Myxococcota bacterium]